MKFGVNLLLFSDTVDRKVIERFGSIAELGFDGVEVPIFAPGSIAVDEIRAAAERAGLALTASSAMTPEANLYATDSATRQAGEQFLRDVVDVCRDLGAPVVCGPLFKAVGDFDESMPLVDQRRATAEAAQAVGRYAGEQRVRLALEPLNRFETNLFNLTGDAVAFCELVDEPALGLLLDTFHMHIEEKDSAAAVRETARADRLYHFHASENDRGPAGAGQVHWDPVATSLADAGYDGWIVLESFSQTNQAIRKAVSCWRPFYESPEQFMAEGLRFVKHRFGG